MGHAGVVGHVGVGWVMNSRDVLPKNVPGVGWGESCRAGVGWDG